MDAIDIPKSIQYTFFKNFEERFKKPVSKYNLVDWSAFTTDASKHWVAYDENDLVSPHSYINAFLDSNPAIEFINYIGAGHERIIKSPTMIEDLFRILG